MKKLFVALVSLVCVAACAFIFSACDGNPDSGIDDGNKPPHTITKVTVDKSSLVMEVGEMEVLAASVLPQDAQNKKIRWISSKMSVVDFLIVSLDGGYYEHENYYDQDGNAIIGAFAVAEGKATIAAVSDEIYDVGYISDGSGGFKLDEGRLQKINREVSAILNGEVRDEKINKEIRDRIACCDVTVENGGTENGITFKAVIDDYNGERSYKVTSIDKTIDTDVVIPAEYKGKPVTAIAEDAFKDCNLVTGITIPGSVGTIGRGLFADCSSITSVTILDGVAYIRQGAFEGCTALTSITVPNSVVYIERGAFRGCTALTSMTLPFVGCRLDSDYDGLFGCIFGADFYDNNHAAYVPSSLKTVTITGGTVIYPVAFSGCSNITSIILPDSVTSINTNALNGCTSLTGITVGANNTAYASEGGILYNKAKTEIKYVPLAISGAVTLPDGLDYIGWGAFNGCASLTGITIPDSVTSIGVYAFSGCTSLTDITIPDGVRSIGTEAFEGCTSLASVTIPDSVTSIGTDAFKGCPIKSATISVIACGYIRNSALQTVVITGGDYISNYAFSECTSLTSITIPDSVTAIGDSAFYGCTNLTEIKGAKNIAAIGQNALTGTAYLDELLNNSDGVVYWGRVLFAAASDVTECVVKEGTTLIMAQVFKESSLTSITIPASVASIGNEAFADCQELSSITFESNSQLSSIGESAFIGCIALEEVVIPASVVSIGYWAFADCQELRTVTFAPNSQLSSVGESVFSGCCALEEIILPPSVTAISFGIFQDCANLKTVAAPLNGIKQIPSSVLKLTITNGETIAAGALSTFYNLTELVISDKIQAFEVGALRGLSALQKLTLPHFKYKGTNGTLYDDQTLGKLFGQEQFNGTTETEQVISNLGSDGSNPIFGKYYIPDSLTHVTVTGDLPRIGAFSGCTNLTDIAILGEVTMIPYYTFYNCTSLRTIVLPSALKTINHFAIYECGGALEKIFYAGTGSWSFPQSVNLGAKVSVYATNDDISTKVYFYSKSKPEGSGRYWHYDEDGITPIAWAAQE